MIPRREIDELKARYKLEPTLNDIFVEGDKDKRFLDKAYSEISVHRPVYSISTINIPVDTLVQLGLTDGNRQRVIALCQILSLPKSTSVRYMIDADMDRHLEQEIICTGLVYTKFTDIEGFFLFNKIIKNLVVDAGRANIQDWDIIFQDIEDVVKTLFSIRLAMADLGFSCKLPNFQKSLKVKDNRVHFDFSGFMTKIANELRDKDSACKISECSKQWLAKIANQDARSAGRGHDYIHLLQWVITNFRGKKKIAEGLDDIIILLTSEVAKEITENL